MQMLFFKKTEYPNGKLPNAKRYTCSIADGVLGCVALIGKLESEDEDFWRAPYAEVSASCPATADNGVALFRQAAVEIGGYNINETYIRSLFEEDEA